MGQEGADAGLVHVGDVGEVVVASAVGDGVVFVHMHVGDDVGVAAAQPEDDEVSAADQDEEDQRGEDEGWVWL
jgi:hypothetical protein